MNFRTTTSTITAAPVPVRIRTPTETDGRPGPQSRRSDSMPDGIQVKIDGLFGTTAQPVSPNADRLLRERFLLALENGSVETFGQMVRRVARTLAGYEKDGERFYWEELFFAVMAGMLFHPGSRVMANAGTSNQQLANCFVLPLQDDRHAILKTFAEACDIKGNGGGCGFNYSAIRPRNQRVREHEGLACGPTAFLKLFDEASAIFRQKGRYESGNMAILNVDHPDIVEFISAKATDGALPLTNISVGTTDAFMRAVEADRRWSFTDPSTNQSVGDIPARELFATICGLAWQTGDPGLIFLDRINEDNPLLEAKGPIIATNTCGEIGLFPYESCNLGYINLVNLLLDAERRSPAEMFDMDRLEAVVHVGLRMIDNAISASWFPIEQINEAVRANRRAGLGVTGWADCLSLCGIPYDSEVAIERARHLSRALRSFAEDASRQLASEKGPYPNSVHSGQTDRRNISLLALPPSGNNAIIFDTSFSIEPHFSLSYTERVMGDQTLQRRNRHLAAVLRKSGLDPELVFRQIQEQGGSIQGLTELPASIRECFKTAHEISPEAHVRMQAAFQENIDNAVTKTVNLPGTATPDDVAACYRLAWSLRCKGITIYRNGSRGGQAIAFDSTNGESEAFCEECAGAG